MGHGRSGIEGGTARQQAGADGDGQPVGEAGLQQRGVDRGPAFDHEGTNAPLTEDAQGLGQMNAPCLKGHGDDGRALMGEGREAVRRWLGTGEQPGRKGMFQKAGVVRKAQMGIQHDGLGRGAFDASRGESRVVGQDGANAYQDTITKGAEAVGEPHGCLTTEGKGSAIRPRDAAIEALSPGLNDQGALVGDGGVGQGLEKGLGVSHVW